MNGKKIILICMMLFSIAIMRGLGEEEISWGMEGVSGGEIRGEEKKIEEGRILKIGKRIIEGGRELRMGKIMANLSTGGIFCYLLMKIMTNVPRGYPGRRVLRGMCIFSVIWIASTVTGIDEKVRGYFTGEEGGWKREVEGRLKKIIEVEEGIRGVWRRIVTETVINITVNLVILFSFGYSYIKLEELGQVGMNEDALKRLVMFVLFRAGINIMDEMIVKEDVFRMGESRWVEIIRKISFGLNSMVATVLFNIRVIWYLLWMIYTTIPGIFFQVQQVQIQVQGNLGNNVRRRDRRRG